jgi:hypothetical protein
MSWMQIVIILCVTPWIVFMSFIAKSMVASWKIDPRAVISHSISDRVRRERRLREQYPDITELHRKARKWLKITLITWVIVFALTFAVVITCILIK